MNLAEIRELAGNLADYDPNTIAYNASIDRLINNSLASLFALAPWSFSERVAKVTAHADATATDGVTTATSKNITTVAAFFESWMEGQAIEISGKEYEITQVMSTTSAYVGVALTTSASDVTFLVKHRTIDLPTDVDTILNVTRTEYVTGGTVSPGSVPPLTRFDGDFWQLSLAETGLPVRWIPMDAVTTRAPASAPVLATAAGAAWPAGDYLFKVGHKYAGRYSQAHPTYVTFTSDGVTAVRPTITLPSNGTGSGYRYVIYCVPPGFRAYRIFSDDIAETGGTIALGAPPTSTWQWNARMTEAGGHTKRIMLHPRQDSTTEYSVRFRFRAAMLIEDQDTPEVPEPQHHVISEMVMVDLYARKDNIQQSRVYEKRVENTIGVLRALYLTESPSRCVKGSLTYGSVGSLYPPNRTITHIG